MYLMSTKEQYLKEQFLKQTLQFSSTLETVRETH